ncbi:MAG: VOC family protein, partial [Actinomycetota bacterium]
MSFYEGLTGSTARSGIDHAEFSVFGDGSGFQLLVQGIEGQPGVHIDVHTDDLEAEVSRLVALGAVERVRHGHWVVLEDPAGMAFCVVPTTVGDRSLEGANVFDDNGTLLQPEPRLTPFLWMDGRIGEALTFYSSI